MKDFHKAKAHLELDYRNPNERKRICITVYFNREKRRYPAETDILLTKEEFSNKALKKTKTALQECEEQMNTFNAIIDELGYNFSFEKFKSRLKLGVFGSTPDRITFRQVAEEYLEAGDITESTKQSYRGALNWMERYHKGTYLEDMTQQFVMELIRYIREEHRKERGKPLSENTLRIYLRGLRAIYNYALEEKYTAVPNPFSRIRGVPLGSIPRQKMAMSERDLKEFNAYVPKNPQEEFSKDFYLLSMQMCGANMTDILSLTNRNIQGDRIVFTRRKTRKTGLETVLDINEAILDTLSKYGRLNPSHPNDLVLPYLLGAESEEEIYRKTHNFVHRVNKGLESISANLGIRKLTTYNARHTYASTAQSLGMSAEQIQKFLSHSSSSTTQVYLSSITESVHKANLKVLDFLNSK